MDPLEDGVTHINVYSKAKTKLGQLLSNFAYSPITTEDGEFSSIEGYWYWLGTTHPDRDKLRALYGYEAKKVGRELRADDWQDNPEFKKKIRLAILNKVCSSFTLSELLKHSTLPLVHYYVYGDKVIEPQEGKWVIEFIDALRTELQRDQVSRCCN